MGCHDVTVYPDAGAVENCDVLLNYFRTFYFLSVELRLEVVIAWWGQSSKARHKDADDFLLEVASAREKFV